MKKFLARLFFWDRPAQGAFLGMTMLMALPWIYFTLFCVLMGNEGLMNWVFHGTLVVSIPFIIVGIPLYTLFVYAKSLGQTISLLTRRPKRLLRWAFIYLLFLLPPVFTIEFLARLDFFILPESFSIFTFCIFLFLFGSAFLFPSCGAKWKSLAIVLLWPMGFTGLCLMFAYGVLPFFVTFDKLPAGPLPLVQYHDFKWLSAIRDFIKISGVGWKWLAIITFLCLFAGYVLQAQALCRFWKVSYKELLSKRTIFVLALSLLVYLVSLPFALFEEAKYRHLCQDLERHMGKTIFPQNQAEEPNNDYQHDERAWRELKRASEKVILRQEWKDQFYLGSFNEIDPLTSEWEDCLLEKWATFYLSQKKLEFINEFFDDEIPPVPRHYHDFAACELMGDDYPDSKIFHTCFTAQLWQLRFALEAGDATQACLLLARMQKICSYLYKKDLPAYLAARMSYLNALCRFIESGLADRPWIDSQRELFRKLEEESGLMEERKRLQAIVRWCAVLEGIAHRLDDAPISVGAELSQLRWFFPQAWWPASAQARTALEVLGEFQAEGDRPSSYSGDTFAAREIDHIKRYVKQANTLAICGRVLLDAEKLRLQTGSYPETMSSLPLDPFTQKTLQYEVGAFEFEIQFVRNGAAKDGSDNDRSTEDCDCREYVNPRWNNRTSTAKMVRVFSPRYYNFQSKYDDICFFIRLDD
ncbi:MAG: hypothetical protein WCT05_11890 [Lentisphaeria bacterium]